MPEYLAKYSISGRDPEPGGMYFESKTISRELKFESPDDAEALKTALKNKMHFASVSGISIVDRPYDKGIILTALLEIRNIPLSVKLPKKEPSWDKTELADIAILDAQ